MSRDLGHLREHYVAGTLRRADLAADPIAQFERWWDEWLATDRYDPGRLRARHRRCRRPPVGPLRAVPRVRCRRVRALHQPGEPQGRRPRRQPPGLAGLRVVGPGPPGARGGRRCRPCVDDATVDAYWATARGAARSAAWASAQSGRDRRSGRARSRPPGRGRGPLRRRRRRPAGAPPPVLGRLPRRHRPHRVLAGPARPAPRPLRVPLRLGTRLSRRRRRPAGGPVRWSIECRSNVVGGLGTTGRGRRAGGAGGARGRWCGSCGGPRAGGAVGPERPGRATSRATRTTTRPSTRATWRVSRSPGASSRCRSTSR